jgi:hypothetical protein
MLRLHKFDALLSSFCYLFLSSSEHLHRRSAMVGLVLLDAYVSGCFRV